MNPVQLYFDLPKVLYSNEKIILCAGYLNDLQNIDRVELIANNLVIGSCKTFSHFDKKIQKKGFLIKSNLKDIHTYEDINFFIKTNSKSYKIGHSKVIRSINQINTSKEESVAICMPIFNPDFERFKKQLGSLLEQTYPHFTIIIQDDESESEILNLVEKHIESFPEVVLFKNKENIGFYNNFESLLYRVGSSFKYICFCDQDDIWNKQKLEKQLRILEKKKSDLIYSDLRVLDEKMNVISNTFWYKRSNHLKDFHALNLNNVATGSTILFRQNILKYILPFPQYIPKIYHDHWTCAITEKRAKVDYLDEALVDYIQHDFNVTGFSEFKRPSFFHRFLSFFALINICRKIAFNKNISDLDTFIEDNQKVYFTNFQKLKLMYLHLDYITFKKMNTKKTDLKILFQLLRLSIISPIKNYYFNRTEVALYTSIFVHYALNFRYLLKRNG